MFNHTNKDDSQIKKSTKKNHLEEKTTLDLYHKHLFENIKTRVLTKDELLEEAEGLKHLIQGMNNNEILLNQYENRLTQVEKEMSELEGNQPIYDYFLKTGDILFNYYDIQERISSGESIEKYNMSRARPGNVLSAFTEAAIKDGTIEKTTEVHNSSALPVQGREKLLEKYLEIVDPNYTKKAISEIEEKTGECSLCGDEMIFSSNEAIFNCPSCGNQEFILMDSDRPSYKDPPRETSYYAYKRINHFNELLAQFQAKESTDIPTDVFDNILLELKKERITDMSNLKITKLREILRKLKCTKYYEHIPTIIYRLNGKSAQIMSREVEEKLRHMFKEIQPSFQKHCPKNRRNFLSYHYVLYKFCELLEMDEFLHCFPLLKNRDKLYQQDKIWQLICREMGWEFLRSI